MKIKTAILIVITLLLLPLHVLADHDDEKKVVSGKISIAEKYDSNVDLVSDHLPDYAEDEDVEAAWITELSATLLFASQWDSPWRLELELFGLADLFPWDITDSWGIGRTDLYVGYSFGANTLSLLNETRYFTEPDDREFDHFRNSFSLVYQRVFSQLWQARIGYENIVHLYPESNFFNYVVNGGFIEVRNTWLYSFSTYYSYGFQHYLGKGVTDNQETLGSPDNGVRQTAEIGFEWFFLKKNTLVGSYSYQWDDSSDDGVQQIGDFRGEEENLELDAEFNFIKHKGLLLYSHRFNDRFTVSLYGEMIHKLFPQIEDTLYDDRERTDILLLGSAWFTARLWDELYAKTRYVYRENQSTNPAEDFKSHTGYLGLEYRF